MTKSIDVERRIAELEGELRDAKAWKKQLEDLPEPKRLATLLHEKFCTWNHTDGCAWEYEFKDRNPDWGGRAHKRWLGNALKLMRTTEKLKKEFPEMTIYEACKLLASEWPPWL